MHNENGLTSNNFESIQLEENKQTITWENINVFSNKNNKCLTLCKKKTNESAKLLNGEIKNGTKQILNNINGIVHSGQSVAILGPSGSGKTSLLNVLNFRLPSKLDVHGTIKINGKKIKSEQLGTHTAYIQQDDIFIGTLTVYEHLKFLVTIIQKRGVENLTENLSVENKAMLKMPKNCSKSERLRRVEEVLIEFNLVKCRNTKIGHVDKGGISGGEKRRLSFASEILTDPQILFCDEPTTGLDSHMVKSITNTISKLSSRGKIVICTIHQPSSQVYEKFDIICLLAQGRVAYFGKRKNTVEFFQGIGHICPAQFNPADFFIDLLSTNSQNVDGLKNVQSICDSYDSSIYKQITVDDIKNSDKTSQELKSDVSQNRFIAQYKASYFTQFIWLLWRQFKTTLREPFSTWIIFAQSITVGLFFGFTYFREETNQTSIQNKNGLVFMMIMHSVFGFIFGSLDKYFAQESITKREVRTRIYSIFIYYLTKTLSEVPQNILFPIITTSAIYWIASLHTSIIVYLKITTIIVLSANASAGFGTILAMFAPNLDGAIGLLGPTVMPLLIFSGFLVNNESTPVYFVWIKYVSWIYYAFEAIMINIWTNTENLSCEGGINLPIMENFPIEKLPEGLADQLLEYNITDFIPTDIGCIKDGQSVLTLLSIDPDNYERDIYVLLSMTVFFPIIAGLMLYLRYRLTR